MNSISIKRFTGMLAVLCAAFHFVPSASAQLMRHDVPDQDYVNAASDSRYDSVVGIRFTNYGGETINGSGVYLGGGWVLTAGHVFRDSASEPLYSNFSLVTGGNNVLSDPGYSIDASSVVFHPGFQDAILPNDLALFHDPLYETLGLSAATIDPLYSPTAGDVMNFAAYGLPGVANDDFYERDGILRGGENWVDSGLSFGTPGYHFEMRMDNPITGTLPLEMGLTSGASGAPIFYGDSLIGLGNYATLNPLYGHRSGVELLGAPGNYDWIQQTTVPAPGAGALLLFGGLGACRRRRA